ADGGRGLDARGAPRSRGAVRVTPPGRRQRDRDRGRDRGRGRDRERGRDRDRGREHRWAPGEAARYAAYQAVAAVHRDDAYANLVLPAILARADLSDRDAALATELTYGTLRRQGTLDEIIAAAADRPVDRIDPPARD